MQEKGISSWIRWRKETIKTAVGCLSVEKMIILHIFLRWVITKIWYWIMKTDKIRGIPLFKWCKQGLKQNENFEVLKPQSRGRRVDIDHLLWFYRIPRSYKNKIGDLILKPRSELLWSLCIHDVFVYIYLAKMSANYLISNQ